MPDNDPGTPLGANYSMFEVLGRGGMGEVRRGRTSNGGAVAIKLLRPEFAADPAIVARFLQERGILVGLAHPNIVSVRDLVAEGSTLAIVMDLVAGRDLREQLDQRRTLPAAEALGLVAGILRGLSAVHGAGVVHRDIKPENVLLQPGEGPGSWPIPRITDFGVSKILASKVSSRRTSVIGTPEYMAPELIDDSEPTVASDLYSVGVVLYELICGVTPFAGGSPLAVLRKHAEALPGRPVGVPNALWEVISGFLAKNPSERPASAALAAAAVEALLPDLRDVEALPALDEPPPVGSHSETVHTSVTTPTGATPDEERRPHKGRRVIAAAVGAVVLVALGAGAFATMRGGDEAATTSSSPAPTAPPSPVATNTPTDPPETSPSPSLTSSAGSPSTGSSALLPTLTGGSLSEAAEVLAQIGVEYQVREVLDKSVPDNTVIGQDPAAGQPAGRVVVLDVAREPSVTYLADMGTLGDSPDTSAVSISGQRYVHALQEELWSCSSTAVWEYDLGRGYQQLEAVVGVADSSSSGDVVNAEVLLDSRPVWSKDVRLGKPKDLSIDVEDALRLVFRMTMVKCAEDGIDTTAALGDPQLLGARPENP